MKQFTLRIKSHFFIIQHSAREVELRSSDLNPISFIIYDEFNTDKLYPILKALNGKHTVQEVSEKYDVSYNELEGILGHLYHLGVLEKTGPDTIHYRKGCEPIRLTGLYKNKENILIIGEETISEEIRRIIMSTTQGSSIAIMDSSHPVITSIRENSQWIFDGFMLQEALEKFSWWKDYFIVLALERSDPILATRLNQINYALDIPWIHGAMDGPFIFIGPTFIPQRGPCYHCFDQYINMNLHDYTSYREYKKMSVISDFYRNKKKRLFSEIYVFSSHLAMETINYCFSKIYVTKSKVLSIYLPTMTVCSNEILALPECPICSMDTDLLEEIPGENIA